MTKLQALPRRAGAREWAGLALLALPCLLVSMDAHVLNLAIPQLTADLRPTNAQLLWIVDSYGFLVAGSLMTMGALGDRIGRRRLLLIGAAAFGLASLLAAFSTSPEMLIAARVLLGLAGATLMPSTLALIRVMFPDPRQRTTALGVWTASFALGGVLAPLVAGILLRHFWWGSVFLFAVPLIAVLLALGRALLPEFREHPAPRVDAASAALSLAGVLSAVYGLKRAAQSGVDPAAAVALALGIGLATAFLRRQRGRANPWIDLALFRRRELLAAARGERAELLRPLRHAVLHRPVPPARARAVAARSRPVDDPVGAGVSGRLRGWSRWPRTASGRVVADERKPGGHGRRLRASDAGRAGVRPRLRGDRLRDLLARALPRLRAGRRDDGRVGAAGAVGRRLRAARDHREPRRRARHRVPRQPRRRDLSPRHRRGGACGAGELGDSARDAFTLAFTTVELVGAGIMAALAVTSALLLRPRPRSSSSRHALSPATPRSRR